MKKFAVLLFSVAMTGAFGATHLKVGDKAPEFSLSATTGGKVALSDFLGKQILVVGFFPAAFTGG